MKNNQGFTFIELMVVIVVGGVLMAIAIQTFSRIRRSADITDDMHAITTFLKAKRLAAFTMKKEIDIEIASDGESISATIDPSGDNESYGSVDLTYPVEGVDSDGDITTTFTINSRGLFYETIGNIHLEDESYSADTAYSCADISLTRTRLGVWDGADCETE